MAGRQFARAAAPWPLRLERWHLARPAASIGEMGFFDWLRPRPPTRFGTAIARELAQAVFALHPSALDRVVVTLRGGVVASMAVPALDPARTADSQVDPALQTARISALVGELANSAPPTSGDTLTVMRDRVIWMPSVITFGPPVA